MNSFGFYDVYYSKKRNESYVVQKGDSLYKIAQKYGVTVEELVETNKLESTVIYPNQVILLPVNNYSYYITKDGDTLDMVSEMFKKNKDLLIKENESIYLLPGQILVSLRK